MKGIVLACILLVLGRVDTARAQEQAKADPLTAYFFGMAAGTASRVKALANIGGMDTSKTVLSIPTAAQTKIASFVVTITPKNVNKPITSCTVMNNRLSPWLWNKLIAIQPGDIIEVTNIEMGRGQHISQSLTVVIGPDED